MPLCGTQPSACLPRSLPPSVPPALHRAPPQIAARAFLFNRDTGRWEKLPSDRATFHSFIDPNAELRGAVTQRCGGTHPFEDTVVSTANTMRNDALHAVQTARALKAQAEATGDAQVVEEAAARVRAAEAAVLDVWTTMTEGAYRVHRISMASLRNHPSTREVLIRFWRWVQDIVTSWKTIQFRPAVEPMVVFVAHNLFGFDLEVLRREANGCGALPPPELTPVHSRSVALSAAPWVCLDTCRMLSGWTKGVLKAIHGEEMTRRRMIDLANYLLRSAARRRAPPGAAAAGGAQPGAGSAGALEQTHRAWEDTELLTNVLLGFEHEGGNVPGLLNDSTFLARCRSEPGDSLAATLESFLRGGPANGGDGVSIPYDAGGWPGPAAPHTGEARAEDQTATRRQRGGQGGGPAPEAQRPVGPATPPGPRLGGALRTGSRRPYGGLGILDTVRRGRSRAPGGGPGREPHDTASLLLDAAREGNEGVVRALLRAGADVRAATRNGTTALLVAAREGHEGVVRDLLRAGADVRAATDNGTTALLVAAGRGHRGVVNALLDDGADVDAAARNGATPLSSAERNGHRGVVQDLVAAGANAPASRRNRDSTTLSDEESHT